MEEDKRSQELNWKKSVTEKERWDKRGRRRSAKRENSPVTSSPMVADSKALVFTVTHSERSCSFSAVQG